ncbi:ammonia-forming cytochrome c nitrite reductase subunit c552 [Heliorestis acidaminivorans]|uniref:nitrite reductase (cytochrome; ammonia-forming) n=1 Tax=Heliorestis acidaminivorans TaxID=553427 RepID=A0A6I0F3Z1_9FIRM|nr:ammonia-forming cytochrome c nitrite reductase subunit c552 [Heliorestis acidaminivorans]KAB2953447.1 ammonia-forming cytochrome c nitrite reductase subunit c552 [Heliorestis acidaminivorans]
MVSRKYILLLWSVLFLFFIVYLSGCTLLQNRQAERAPVELSEFEADPAVWGRLYPDHYDSYLQNYMISRTEYGGSDMYSKLEREPLLRIIFNGFGFSKEYNEDRGHIYSLEDIKLIDPARKSVGTCITCKTSDFKRIYHDHGENYYTMAITDLLDQSQHPVSCLDCHHPETNELVITRPALIEAFERQGRDITKATRNEMRSLVCAQCHVEYYFEPETKKLVFPWDQGVKADEIYAYFEEIGFSDWVHPDSQTPVLKAQHPDWELNQGSVHQQNGVSCSDCHMPYVRVGAMKISSHWWTSPLHNLQESCGTCHRQSEDYLKERILYTQRRVYDQMMKAQQSVTGAIQSIAQAMDQANVDESKLNEARALHREAQWYVDFISSENSMGFHNPQEALRILADSQRLAGEARVKALESLTGQSLPELLEPENPGFYTTQEDRNPPQ